MRPSQGTLSHWYWTLPEKIITSLTGPVAWEGCTRVWAAVSPQGCRDNKPCTRWSQNRLTESKRWKEMNHLYVPLNWWFSFHWWATPVMGPCHFLKLSLHLFTNFKCQAYLLTHNPKRPHIMRCFAQWKKNRWEFIPSFRKISSTTWR